MRKIKIGFFYQYRGNGYGPFKTEEEAKEDFELKLYADKSDVGIWIRDAYQCGVHEFLALHGRPETDDRKRLIDFEFIDPVKLGYKEKIKTKYKSFKEFINDFYKNAIKHLNETSSGKTIPPDRDQHQAHE